MKKVNTEKLISALISCNTIKEASQQSGVPERTIYTYMQKPDFKQQLNEAKNKMLERTIAKLSSSTTEAADVLNEIMNDKAANPQVRVSSARSVLEFASKYTETLDIVQRLEALERQSAENSSNDEG